jgi:hypothetical protein
MQAIGLKALGTIIAVLAALGLPAAAQDKVKVGVFPTASSLPISWRSSAASKPAGGTQVPRQEHLALLSIER